MLLRIIAVGDKMTSWVNEGFKEYAKRFPPSCKLELLEIPAEKRGKNAPIARLIELEGEKILSVIKNDDYVIALDVNGKSWSTETLAEELKQWHHFGKNIIFLIGGPDGLSQQCLQKSKKIWSLSPLTLPHPLVRIILAEQLYRALSILQGHPYHR